MGLAFYHIGSLALAKWMKRNTEKKRVKLNNKILYAHIDFSALVRLVEKMKKKKWIGIERKTHRKRRTAEKKKATKPPRKYVLRDGANNTLP